MSRSRDRSRQPEIRPDLKATSLVLTLGLVLLLILLLAVLGAEFEALALDLVEFVLNAEPLALVLILLQLLILGLSLCLFEAMFELLAHSGDVITIDKQIAAFACHRNVDVRDVGTAVVSVDRSHRRSLGKELADEPLGLAFEVTPGDLCLGIG